MSEVRDFDVVLRELEAARVHDEELQERDATLDERITSRGRLEELRAEVAQIRESMAPESA